MLKAAGVELVQRLPGGLLGVGIVLMVDAVAETSLASWKSLLVTRGPGNQYTLIAGERRLRAAKLAELEEVPVILLDRAGQDESLELALIENMRRKRTEFDKISWQ